MKTYPSITNRVFDAPIFAFNKYDGSNIRVEWSNKQGFYKFGSRKVLLDCTHLLLGEAPELIQTKFGDELHQIFVKQNYESVVAFFEFFGSETFAGKHILGDSNDAKLIDIAPYKKGVLEPSQFLDLYGGLDHAEVVYRGVADEDFIRAVKESEVEGMNLEGVVCKADLKHKHRNQTAFKVKTDAWLEHLKRVCKDDDNLFNRLK